MESVAAAYIIRSTLRVPGVKSIFKGSYLGALGGEGGVAERIEVAGGVLSDRQVTGAAGHRVDKSQAVIRGHQLALDVRKREHYHLRGSRARSGKPYKKSRNDRNSVQCLR